MPHLSRWAIRAALLYLLAGFTIGSSLLVQKGVPFIPGVWRLVPAHIEFLILGWCAQLSLGVAYWVLPRFRKAPKRGDPRPAWLAVGMLNVGIWLVAIAPFVDAALDLRLLGRIAELGAAVAFAWHSYPRVRSLR